MYLHGTKNSENIWTERIFSIAFRVGCCVFLLHLATLGCTTKFGPGKPVCGNGVIEGDEICDGEELRGETCESLGLGVGTLACRADCTGYDASGCAGEPQCGNNIIQGDQVCDGTDLAGQTCESQGFYEGELACEDDCSAFDTSGCEGFCGDGIINGDEVCDGDDLGDETCESQGYEGGGTLVCLADCSNFSLTNCIAEPTHYKLTVTTEGEGRLKVGDIDVGVSHSDHYVENTVVTVEAIPTDGWEFTGWTGDVITTETLIEVTMDSDKSLQARFREILVPTSFGTAYNLEGEPSNDPADWRFDVIVLDQNGDPFLNATGLVVTEKDGEGLSDHERIESGHLADSMNNASTDSDGKMTIYYTDFKLVEGLGANWERTQNVIYLINGEEMSNAIAITVEMLPFTSNGRNIIKAVEALP